MRYFNQKDLRIAYWSKGAGDPILFLHNGGTSHCIWQDQMDALANRYHVIALDLPGYGESVPAQAGYSLAAYTDIISQFIDTLLPGRPLVLVGNCMGSAIALSYAQQKPDRVRALVLLNPLTMATFKEGGLGVLMWLKRNAPDFTDILSEKLGQWQLPGWFTSPGILLQSGTAGRKRQLWRHAALRACYDNPNEMAALTGLFQQLPHYECLDHLSPDEKFPPRYVIWGRQNRVLSAKAGGRLNLVLRPRQALCLEDCGHLLMMERPEEVARVIEEACIDTSKVVKAEIASK